MKKFYLLMNGLGDGDGGAGAPATPPPAAPPVAPPAVEPPAWTKDLKLEVDNDILIDPSLKAITDVNSLVKSYVHAQRKIGQKGVLIPTENSPKEEWDQLYQKLGIPLEDTKYNESLQFPKENAAFTEEFNKEFAKLAFENRIHPKQAQKAYEFFNSQAKATAERFATEHSEKVQAELDALKNELGADAYGVKLTKANNFLKENAGPEFMKYLAESGLGKDAKVVKALMNIADKFTKEDNIPTGENQFGLTRDEINKQINQTMGNFDDPYHKPNHPDHKRRVAEIQSLFAKLDKK